MLILHGSLIIIKGWLKLNALQRNDSINLREESCLFNVLYVHAAGHSISALDKRIPEQRYKTEATPLVPFRGERSLPSLIRKQSLGDAY